MHLDRPLIFARHPVSTGVALGVVALLPHTVLTPPLSLAYAAILLGFIASIYVGFAVLWGAEREQWTELIVAGVFGLAALLGFAIAHWLLPTAYVVHAAWDALHHMRSRLKLVAIPQWYIPWCATADIVIGIGLAGIWRRHGLL